MSSPSKIPRNWIAAENDFARDDYWGDAASDGVSTAAEYGLQSPKPILRGNPTAGLGHYYIFQAGTTYYVWNMIERAVCKIAEPSDINSIVDKMIDAGGWFGSLKLEDIPPVVKEDV